MYPMLIPFGKDLYKILLLTTILLNFLLTGWMFHHQHHMIYRFQIFQILLMCSPICPSEERSGGANIECSFA